MHRKFGLLVCVSILITQLTGSLSRLKQTPKQTVAHKPKRSPGGAKTHWPLRSNTKEKEADAEMCV